MGENCFVIGPAYFVNHPFQHVVCDLVDDPRNAFRATALVDEFVHLRFVIFDPIGSRQGHDLVFSLS